MKGSADSVSASIYYFVILFKKQSFPNTIKRSEKNYALTLPCLSLFLTQPHAEHTQIIIDVIQYAYCSYISFFKDQPHAKHAQTSITVIQYTYYVRASVYWFC